ncbi:MAG: alpha/beta fold hydrolase [Pseudomonadota bacterium]
MRLITLICAALVLFANVALANNPTLERRPFLGVAPEATDQGVRIASIITGGSAESADTAVGDIVLSLNDHAVVTPQDFIEQASNLVPGREIELEFLRDGQTQTVTLEPRARPFEQPAIGQVRYDHVNYAGGRIRAIVNTPNGEGPFPTVYYIQGYPCSSVESSNPDNFNRRKVQSFVQAGFAVVRVEKPGVGDSDGPLECTEIGFDEELGGFAAGWDYARELPETRDDQMIMVGISMGGVQAPLLAAASEHKPLGIVVWGTRMDNWHDYMYGLMAFQPVLLGYADPVESFARAEAARPVLKRFLLDQEPIERILSDTAEAAEVFGRIGMTPNGRFFGRDGRFFQQIAAQNLPIAWRDSNSAVLSLYGASDITAIDGFSQEMIASVVNFYRPGTASFEVIPDTTHAMIKVGSRADYRRNFQQGSMPSLAEGYNPAVAERMVKWSKDLLEPAEVSAGTD